MILSITVLCLLVMQASLMPLDDSEALLKYHELYHNIIIGQYNSAAGITVDLENDGRGDVITVVVNRLLAESQRNVVDYAYKLVRKGETDIVNRHFPIQLRWIVMGEELIFFNRRDGMALKLEWNADNDGDRGAYGDTDEWAGKRMSWKIIPHWYKGSRAYFEIFNVHFDQYLKLEVNSDGDGERRGFGDSHHNTKRHLWYFHPVMVNNELLFYIFNRQYDQPLKLARHVDGDGDRRVWGYNGSPLGNPDYYAWHVRLHKDYE